MARQISYKQLPAMMAASQKGVKFAAARTLNDIAFNGVRAIPQKAELNFKRNARQALGFRVTRARARRNQSADAIEAQVWTNRGWVAYHIEEGRRRAREGWKFRGENYIVIPNKANQRIYFTARGRLRAKFKRALFVIPSTRGATIMHRGKRNRQTRVVAFLRREVKFHKDLNYEKTMDDLFRRNVGTIFAKHLRSEVKRNFR